MPKLCDNRDTGGALLGPRGALAPLANENSHYVNSKMAIIHYCSKRVAPPHLSEIQGQAPPVIGGLVFPPVQQRRPAKRKSTRPKGPGLGRSECRLATWRPAGVGPDGEIGRASCRERV